MLVITSTVGLLGFYVEVLSARGKLFGVGSFIRLLTVSVLGLKVVWGFVSWALGPRFRNQSSSCGAFEACRKICDQGSEAYRGRKNQGSHLFKGTISCFSAFDRHWHQCWTATCQITKDD